MKYKNILEEALKDIHAREYPMVLDDDLSDHFANWVSELDPNYIIDVWSSVQTHLIKLLTDSCSPNAIRKRNHAVLEGNCSVISVN